MPVLLARALDRTMLTFTGAQAATVVNGLVTNEVTALTPGQGCYAAALSPKGRLIADLRIFRTEDGLCTEAGATAGPGWLALVRKYVNPRLAKVVDDSTAVEFLLLAGEGALALLPLAGPLTDPYMHTACEVAGVSCHVARLPDFGVEGALLWCPAGGAEQVHNALISAGAVAVAEAALEPWRIGAGYPRYGVDMSDAMLVQEANLDALGAVSWTKGCYTGQEVVARLHYRGHVNRQLRGLRLEAAVAPGSVVTRQDGSSVGDVRSVATSAEHGVIAFALLRREVETGETVAVLHGEGHVSALVLPMPLR